ncbi:MAG: PTS sugar transporter subunit IIA [Chloroflexi bacterium]|nr:PTS sugar transporter subunit IIA [Chloroflexota bacterium]
MSGDPSTGSGLAPSTGSGPAPVGLVIASHGDLSRALLNTAEMIVGPQDGVQAVCLHPQDSLEHCHRSLQEAIGQVDRGGGVLVLIDLFGGTPGNAAALGLRERWYPVVAGVNLPMLLEVLMNRDGSLSAAELSALALQAGQAGLIDVSARLQAQMGITGNP